VDEMRAAPSCPRFVKRRDCRPGLPRNSAHATTIASLLAPATTPAFANRLAIPRVLGMAPFFRRKTQMEKFETDLAALRAREETFGSRHAAAEAAFVEAKSKLQRHHLEADLDADEKASAKLEAALAACALTRDGYADALGEVQAKIADVERQIAAERLAIARAAAAEKLARDLDEVEQALPGYLEAAGR
jgi:hypothetical protein